MRYSLPSISAFFKEALTGIASTPVSPLKHIFPLDSGRTAILVPLKYNDFYLVTLWVIALS